MRAILRNMFATYDTFVVHYDKICHTQVSTNDSGLLALAYVSSLCLNYESSLILFDQVAKRESNSVFIDGDLKEYKVLIISNNTTSDLSEMTSYSLQYYFINII